MTGGIQDVLVTQLEYRVPQITFFSIHPFSAFRSRRMYLRRCAPLTPLAMREKNENRKKRMKEGENGKAPLTLTLSLCTEINRLLEVPLTLCLI